MADNIPPLPALDALKPQPQKFVIAYLLHGNGTKAVMDAGYTDNPASAGVQAVRLLKNAKVRRAIDEEVAKLREKYRLTVERILQELAYIGLVDVKDAYRADGSPKEITEMPESITRAIASIELEEPLPLFKDTDSTRTKTIKFHDKVRALQLAGQHLKMFTEKHEFGGLGGGPITLRWEGEAEPGKPAEAQGE